MSSKTFTVMDLVLEPEPLDLAQIVEGTPEISGLVLSEEGPIVRGVWQCTPGVVTDVEQDEMLVVVSGRATVEVEGGETLELSPGVVCLLKRGARTVWTVHETLRKVYQTTLHE